MVKGSSRRLFAGAPPWGFPDPSSRPGHDHPVAAELKGLAAVGGPQQLGGEGGADRPEADLVTVEQADLVAGEVGQAQVVGGHDDRRPAGPQPGQGGQQQILGEGVDPVERLVEQQQPRLLGDRPGQQDPLALAAGEGAEPGRGPLGQAEGRGQLPLRLPTIVAVLWRIILR
jgi:hypothetical protein